MAETARSQVKPSMADVSRPGRHPAANPSHAKETGSIKGRARRGRSVSESLLKDQVSNESVLKESRPSGQVQNEAQGESVVTLQNIASDEVAWAKTKEWGLLCCYIYLDQGCYGRALNLLEAFYTVFRRETRLIKMLAYGYLKSKQYKKCVRACERYIAQVKPNSAADAPIYLMMSDALSALDEKRLAINCYRRYLQLVNSDDAQ